MDMQLQKGNLNTSTVTKKVSNTLGTLPSASRTGFVFDGWYTDPVGGTKVTSSTTIAYSTNKTVNLYAHWKMNVYSIELHNESGKWGTKGMAYKSAIEEIDRASEMKTKYYNKTGYTLNGLYDETTGEQYYDGNLSSVKRYLGVARDVQLKPRFTANTYTLTYSGGSGCTSQTGKYDGTWGTLCTPSANTGYVFDGWYTGSNGSVTKITSSTKVTGNVTVNANWIRVMAENISYSNSSYTTCKDAQCMIDYIKGLVTW